jgi:hypothetical protein
MSVSRQLMSAEPTSARSPRSAVVELIKVKSVNVNGANVSAFGDASVKFQMFNVKSVNVNRVHSRKL